MQATREITLRGITNSEESSTDSIFSSDEYSIVELLSNALPSDIEPEQDSKAECLFNICSSNGTNEEGIATANGKRADEISIAHTRKECFAYRESKNKCDATAAQKIQEQSNSALHYIKKCFKPCESRNKCDSIEVQRDPGQSSSAFQHSEKPIFRPSRVGIMIEKDAGTDTATKETSSTYSEKSSTVHKNRFAENVWNSENLENSVTVDKRRKPESTSDLEKLSNSDKEQYAENVYRNAENHSSFKNLGKSSVPEKEQHAENVCASENSRKFLTADETHDIERVPSLEVVFSVRPATHDPRKKSSSPKNRRRLPKPVSRAKRSCSKCVNRVVVFVVSTFGLVIFVAAYCVFGAWLFIRLERDADEARRIADQQLRNQTLQALWHLMRSVSETNTTTSADDAWMVPGNDLLMTLLRNTSVVNVFGGESWSFFTSLFFAVTVVTTIGYGVVAPITWQGRLACVLYGLIGIPVTLACLANIGYYLASLFRFVYVTVVCQRRAADDSNNDNDNDNNDDDELQVPVVVCALFLFGYLCLGAWLFNVTDGWPYLHAFYFCFITLSTIGFGDMVPGFDDKGVSPFRQVACLFYLLVGLALLVMSFELMGQNYKGLFQQIGKSVGVLKEEEEKKEKEKKKEKKKKKTTKRKNTKAKTPAEDRRNEK